MKEKLTTAQNLLLNEIKEFHKNWGYIPTYTELAEILKISTSTVFATMKRLEQKGYIKRNRQARRLEIL